MRQRAVADPQAQTCALLVSADRRYRAVASMLLDRRGYRVLLADGSEDIADVSTREGAEVVVIDASASLAEAAREATKLQALCPSVAVVVVSDDRRHDLESHPVVLKWGAFGSLLETIERARGSRRWRRS